jgi:hypothetical protein
MNLIELLKCCRCRICWRLSVGLVCLLAGRAVIAQHEGTCPASGECTMQTTTAAMAHATGMFAGVKVNGGHAIHSMAGGKQVLTLSEDFVVPDSPAPHWQVVDSQGNTYLLNRLKIKEDRYNMSITLPDYIRDVARVQIWCAWAEVLLGEAAFDMTAGGMEMGSHASGMFSGAKANQGHVVHATRDGHQMLTLSDDFVVPDAPAPHWQVVDSQGNTYLLNRLKIKEDRYNLSIMLPDHIRDVARVQIWCAWAETLLGEAAFEMPVR